jgi:tRNA threonylcarbamoyladenosine biosynthesis protein TsaB
MTTLAFDTSDALLSAALVTARGTWVSIHDIGLRHGEFLTPCIAALFKEAGITADSLDLIVCARGPGSFTGLRIGMATAKGLSAGCGAPVVSVHVPDFLARPFGELSLPVIPVLDARKERFYGAVFERGEKQGEYFDLDAASVSGLFPAPHKYVLTGPGAKLLASRLEPADRQRAGVVQSGSAAVLDLLETGIELFASRGPDAAGQGPFYVRRSEAEAALGERNGNRT